MLRKITAILLILLANIVLLVHAVVPHHHHQEQVCIVNEHCQNDSLAHEHNTPEHNHEHDGENSTESCALKQAIVIPANSVRQEYKCIGGDDNHSTFVHFDAILFGNKSASLVQKVVSGEQIPLITTSHSNFVSASIGLRAPPAV